MSTISSFAVTYHEREDSSSEDFSWESDTEPSPLPKMVRESKLLKRKRKKLFSNKRKGRGGKGRGGTVNISQKEKENLVNRIQIQRKLLKVP